MALERDTHAVTDVTGFGLAGHGWEMAERSGMTLVIDTGSVPLYSGAKVAAEAGTRTGGDARNRQYLDGHVRSEAAAALEALVFDPQTSGGLLAAVDPAVVETLLGVGFTRIGEVVDGDAAVVLR